VDFLRQSWLHGMLVILFKTIPLCCREYLQLERYAIQGMVNITLNHEYNVYGTTIACKLRNFFIRIKQ